MIAGRPAGPVILCEDDPDDWWMVQTLWKEAGLPGEIKVVEDGEELLEYLRLSGRYADASFGPWPALILLDLNLPKRDGYDVLAEIKGDPFLASIPIVILSTAAEPESIDRCYRMGAAGYIVKPSEYATLVNHIRAIALYWLETVQLPTEAR